MIEDSVRVRLGMRKRRVTTAAQRLWMRTRTIGSLTDVPPSRPVFILGCPRSGTSLLFNLLKRHPGLRSLGGEGHVLWNTYQHPRLKGWSSDRATAADIGDGEARFLYSAIHRIAGEHRFVEKTPKNVLRVPYLAALFPDARFILLKRDGRAVVNSLIEGWEVRQSPVYRLPQRLELREYRGQLWSFVLPPEWRRYAATSIPEVAAYQFTSSYDTVLPDLAAHPGHAVAELRFEDLLRSPVQEMARLLDGLELAPSDEVFDMARHLDRNVVQSNSPPEPDKWRRRAEQIGALMPRMEPTMRRLGYEVVSA